MDSLNKLGVNINNGVYIKEEIIIEDDDDCFEIDIDSEQSDNLEESINKNLNASKTNTTTNGQSQNGQKPKRPKTDQKRPGTYSDLIIMRCGKCKKIRKRKRGDNDPTCPKCDYPLQYECKNCGKQFNTRGNVYSHARVYCSTSAVYKCDDCDFTTTQQRYLSVHSFNVHTIADPREYNKCAKCERRYKHRKDMMKHQQTCGLKPYLKCKRCKYKTNNARYLRLHTMKRHEVVRPEDYKKCKICGASFKFKLYLTSHMRKGHKLGKQFFCAHCKFKSYSKTKLLNHIQKKHYPDVFKD